MGGHFRSFTLFRSDLVYVVDLYCSHLWGCMTSTKLFRAEALNARHVNWLGNIVLIRPLSFSVLTSVVAVLAAIVLVFLILGTYTKHNTVSGQLIPDTGLVKVYATQVGIVLKKEVAEGQVVRKGDILYVLSSERQSGAQGFIQAAISSQVAARRQSLSEERDKMHLMQGEERAALLQKIGNLKAEAAKLDSQIEGQRSRVKLASESAARYQSLLNQNYISLEQAQQKQEDLLDQQNRLQSLERDRISGGRELDVQNNELAMLAPRQQNQLAQIERSINSVGQELTESEAKRSLVVTAPETGIATGVVAEVGQTVDASRPLVSVVPEGALMQAHLYAPSRSIGFVKPGDKVLLRYQAFPFQKFGHAKGTVLSVSRTALPSDELAGIGLPQGVTGASGEPLYRITVKLATQSAIAYGRAQPLQAGMLLDADILQETRHLYEWVLEPLYSLTGKL
jgi:membrane fusion protein